MNCDNRTFLSYMHKQYSTYEIAAQQQGFTNSRCNMTMRG